jgi:hypothetical protein
MSDEQVTVTAEPEVRVTYDDVIRFLLTKRKWVGREGLAEWRKEAEDACAEWGPVVMYYAQEIMARQETRIAELEAALQKSRVYVYGAYECAFPDEEENAAVLADIDRLLEGA